MPLQFARARFIGRRKNGNAVRSAAYNAAEKLYDQRVGRHYFSAHNRDALQHHEILLPAGASERFRDMQTLWNAVEAAERPRHAQVAREVVMALPDDGELTDSERIELVRGFVQKHFVDNGLAAQIDIHAPFSAETGRRWWHAHVLLTTRRIEGDHLASRKAQDLAPEVRWIGGRPVVTNAADWGKEWRDYQNDYFAQLGKDLRVDLPAIHPGKTLGPRRWWRPDDPQVQDFAKRKKLNAAAARDPEKVAAHLAECGVVDDKVMFRFVGKWLPPFEAEVVADRVRELRYEALEETASADLVPSRWRRLNVEDIARELSPGYAELLKKKAELTSQISKASFVRAGAAERAKEADKRIASRRQQHPIRAALHRTGLRMDPETRALEGWKKGQQWTANQRWAIRLKLAQDRLEGVEKEIAEVAMSVIPQAEAELARRQQRAKDARQALAAMNAIPQAQRSKQRAGARLGL